MSRNDYGPSGKVVGIVFGVALVVAAVTLTVIGILIGWAVWG